MMSVEVNDFRLRMKVFANQKAQERRARLKASWEQRIMYQYPARLVSNVMKTKSRKTQVIIPVHLTWEDKQETEIPIDVTAKQLVESLGQKYGFDENYYKLCCIKTIGEASFLLGDEHKLSDYAFIQENSVPRLVVLEKDSIDIDMANDAIYSCLEKDVLTNDNPIIQGPSWQTMFFLINSDSQKYARFSLKMVL